MFSFLIFVLYYNLTYTKNRLIINFRIVAYIHLFHEDFLAPYWVGWDTSMRYYRKWVNANMKKKEYLEKLKNNTEEDNFHIPKSLFVYRELYFAHVIFILLLLGFMTFRVLNISLTVPTVCISVVILVFFFSKMNPLHYSKFANQIEKERIIWIDVFENEKLLFKSKTINLKFVKNYREFVPEEELAPIKIQTKP